MSENSSTKCYDAINQLANLYVRAFYAYSWVRDIFRQDPLLQSLTTEFIQKTEDAKNCCQKILDFLFENKIHFLLMESSGKLDTDLSNVFEMKNEIKSSLANALHMAEEDGDEKSTKFLKSLCRKEEEPSDNDVKMTSLNDGPENQLHLSGDSSVSSASVSAANSSPKSDNDSIAHLKDDKVNDRSWSSSSKSLSKKKPNATNSNDDSNANLRDDKVNDPSWSSSSKSPSKKKSNTTNSEDDSNAHLKDDKVSDQSWSSSSKSPSKKKPNDTNSEDDSNAHLKDDKINDPSWSSSSKSPSKKKSNATNSEDDSNANLKDDKINDRSWSSISKSPSKKKPNSSKSIDNSNVDSHSEDNQVGNVKTPSTTASMSSTCNSPTLETPKNSNSVNDLTTGSQVEDDQVSDMPLSNADDISHHAKNPNSENPEDDSFRNISNEGYSSVIESDKDELIDNLKADKDPKYKIIPSNKTSFEIEAESLEEMQQLQNERENKNIPKNILVVYSPECIPVCIRDIVFWLHQTYPEINTYITR